MTLTLALPGMPTVMQHTVSCMFFNVTLGTVVFLFQSAFLRQPLVWHYTFF